MKGSKPLCNAVHTGDVCQPSCDCWTLIIVLIATPILILVFDLVSVVFVFHNVYRVVRVHLRQMFRKTIDWFSSRNSIFSGQIVKRFSQIHHFLNNSGGIVGK